MDTEHSKGFLNNCKGTKKRGHGSERLPSVYKNVIFQHYGYKCAYCRVKFDKSTLDTCPTLDHLIPASLGGKNSSPFNYVAACHKCNNERGNADLFEWLDYRNIHVMHFMRKLVRLWKRLHQIFIVRSIRQAKNEKKWGELQQQQRLEILRMAWYRAGRTWNGKL